MYSCHSIPECSNLFFEVKLSIRSFLFYLKQILFSKMSQCNDITIYDIVRFIFCDW